MQDFFESHLLSTFINVTIAWHTYVRISGKADYSEIVRVRGLLTTERSIWAL